MACIEKYKQKIFLKFIPDGILKTSEIIAKNLRVYSFFSSFHVLTSNFIFKFGTKSVSY